MFGFVPNSKDGGTIAARFNVTALPQLVICYVTDSPQTYAQSALGGTKIDLEGAKTWLAAVVTGPPTEDEGEGGGGGGGGGGGVAEIPLFPPPEAPTGARKGGKSEKLALTHLNRGSADASCFKLAANKNKDAKKICVVRSACCCVLLRAAEIQLAASSPRRCSSAARRRSLQATPRHSLIEPCTVRGVPVGGCGFFLQRCLFPSLPPSLPPCPPPQLLFLGSRDGDGSAHSLSGAQRSIARSLASSYAKDALSFVWVGDTPDGAALRR
jgi:hypothetical protein